MLTVEGRRAMLAGFAAAVVEASLHAAEPGEGGAAELVGGLPNYSRVPLLLVVDGEVAVNADPLQFVVPGGSTVTHIGYWSDSGRLVGSRELEQPEAFGGQGTLSFAAGSLRERVDG